MRTVDPGHSYLLDKLDKQEGDTSYEVLTFVKREGPGYPGNIGHHSGTIIQEVMRACIQRLHYVDVQIPHLVNKMCVGLLRMVIYLLEMRAAERHGREFRGVSSEFIEVLPTGRDGHLVL